MKKRWLILLFLIVVTLITYAVLSQSEIDRLSAMCKSISPGMAASAVVARLKEAGQFRISGARPGSGAGAKSWFFISNRYPMLYPASSCHVDQVDDSVTSVRIFLD